MLQHTQDELSINTVAVRAPTQPLAFEHRPVAARLAGNPASNHHLSGGPRVNQSSTPTSALPAARPTTQADTRQSSLAAQIDESTNIIVIRGCTDRTLDAAALVANIPGNTSRLLVLSGCAAVSVGTDSLVLDPTSILAIAGDSAHSAATLERRSGSLDLVLLRTSEGHPGHAARRTCELPNFLRLCALARSIDALRSPASSLAPLARAIESSDVPARQPETAGTARRSDTLKVHSDLVERTRELLTVKLNDPPALDEIAAAVRCSPFHLCRVFRRLTGQSVHQYLTRLRLRTAASRLDAHRADLERLATTVGFASHSHFCDGFKREFTVPPTRLDKALADIVELERIIAGTPA